ncbi:hypothetical protein [Streptomyces sp. NPDC050504]|uniref:hypothetical protein n=1 Tax=Streptomyces sp. NPDC050504 TaxID=3365618 RepID=UPI0037BBEF67
MPDLRRRTDPTSPLTERAGVLLRERGSRTPRPSGDGGSGGAQDDNPFAAPPEDRPDQEWRPRQPAQPSQPPQGENGDQEGSGQTPPSAWGGRWSSRQPGRQGGDFGSRQGNGQGGPGPNGNGNGPGNGAGPRWDPTDPSQRRARYALLAGMWAFFFAIFRQEEIALLLGALAAYWSISSLRAKPAGAAGAAGTGAGAGGTGGAQPAPQAPAPAPPGNGRRQQRTAAVSGLVTASIALVMVAGSFTAQLVYRDYYTCQRDALTKSGELACNDQLPKPLRKIFGTTE